MRGRERKAGGREEAIVIFDRSLVLIFAWPVASLASKLINQLNLLPAVH